LAEDSLDFGSVTHDLKRRALVVLPRHEHVADAELAHADTGIVVAGKSLRLTS
jgi:hypothetical protein